MRRIRFTRGILCECRYGCGWKWQYDGMEVRIRSDCEFGGGVEAMESEAGVQWIGGD